MSTLKQATQKLHRVTQKLFEDDQPDPAYIVSMAEAVAKLQAMSPRTRALLAWSDRVGADAQRISKEANRILTRAAAHLENP